MRKFLHIALAAGLAAFALSLTGPGRAFAQNVACSFAQGGAAFSIGSGCTATVASGGVINVASGGALQIASSDRTAVLATAPAGVAAGYMVARGETALDGSNPTPVTTGLTTITGCSLTIKATAAPGVSTSVLSYSTTSGTLNMYGWKVTSSIDDTLVASTGTDTIGWVCIGT